MFQIGKTNKDTVVKVHELKTTVLLSGLGKTRNLESKRIFFHYMIITHLTLQLDNFEHLHTKINKELE